MSLNRVERGRTNATQGIFAGSDKFKMGGINAGSITAEMVKHRINVALSPDWLNEPRIHHAVDKLVRPFNLVCPYPPLRYAVQFQQPGTGSIKIFSKSLANS